MTYKCFHPDRALKPFISAYLWYHTETNGFAEPMKFVPSGVPTIVFNLGDPIKINNRLHSEGLQVEDDLVIGQQDSYYLLTPGEIYSHFCIFFKPSGLTRLLDLPIHEIVNDAARLKDFLRIPVEKLIDGYREGQIGLKQVIKGIDAWLLSLLANNTRGSCFIDYTLKLINQRKGLVSVSELAGHSNTCIRNYRRKFLEKTGLSPKKYILITRWKRILQALETDQPLKINWSDVTYRSGYYDQMHFIKEFKKFSGETPSAYLKKYSNSRDALEQFLLRVID